LIDRFFPVPGQNVDRARRLCASCPVLDECLAYALPDPDIVGWFGGTSTQDRRRLRREGRRRAASDYPSTRAS
jgi:WhiB family redox-sensing transcriptional regulator